MRVSLSYAKDQEHVAFRHIIFQKQALNIYFEDILCEIISQI